MKKLFAAAWIIALSLFNAAYATAGNDIMIMNAWARVSAPGAPSAGFMTVTNHGSEDDVLLDVSGDFAKKLELHRTQQVDGVMKMIHQKDGVVIPAGGSVIFKPGDYHLMFMGLYKNFELGETYNVTLTFKNAGDMKVELPVQSGDIKMDMNHQHKN
ncbi:MAG: copper chaperone PCu(A)C [Reinekea sp.]|jgi:periplasmic copper chaperone A